ncbi:TetR/AcrR family transcriptional regulator [Aquibacillus sediminis]|uniref:TetR/AcrR family transcriptional regulator n=1 Tax=Aquibacillus sediminis TaxID=2574734 RepID=UPI00110820F2|nr:TetR/AcrR family transcriptional regulator [Aquibacillus sediminis]
MTEKFSNLAKEKQTRILNAALEEFATNGFQQASTNKVVKNAGIGKGMLFYYFTNKKALYDYLIDYSLDVVTNNYLNKIDEKEQDFIKRFKQASQLKMRCYTENPHVFNFLSNLFTGNEPELTPHFHERYQQLKQLGYSKLYDNIDKTLIRSDVDYDKAFQLIKWAIDGYQTDLLTRLKGENMTLIKFDDYSAEFEQYLQILRTVFYSK